MNLKKTTLITLASAAVLGIAQEAVKAEETYAPNVDATKAVNNVIEAEAKATKATGTDKVKAEEEAKAAKEALATTMESVRNANTQQMDTTAEETELSETKAASATADANLATAKKDQKKWEENKTNLEKGLQDALNLLPETAEGSQERKDLEETIKRLESTIAEVELKVADATDKVAEAEVEVKDIPTELSKLEAVVEKLTKLKNAKTELSETKAIKVTADANLVTAKKEQKKWEENKTNLEKGLQDALNLLPETAEGSQERKDLEETIKRLESTIAEVELKVADATDKVAEAEAEVKDIEAELPKLEEAIAALEAKEKKRAVKTELAEVETLKAEVIKFVDTVNKRRDEIAVDYDKAVAALAEAQAEYRKLDPQSAEAIALNNEIEELITEVTEYRELLGDADDQLLEAQAELDDINSYILELKRLLGEAHGESTTQEELPEGNPFETGEPATQEELPEFNPAQLPPVTGYPAPVQPMRPEQGQKPSGTLKTNEKVLPNTGAATNSLAVAGVAGFVLSILGLGYTGRHSRKN